jgi:hypothetical protein
VNVFAIDLKGIRPSEYDEIISLVHMQFISGIVAALTRGSILARNKGYFRPKMCRSILELTVPPENGNSGLCPWG